tara:strand:- start:1514 stop:1630 length:117 start_codon:yes stop_codon:yes gene_type:complete
MIFFEKKKKLDDIKYDVRNCREGGNGNRKWQYGIYNFN